MVALPEHLHPMVVHFPIALFLTAMGLEVASLLLNKKGQHQSALTLFIFAAFIMPLVVKTGQLEAAKLGLNHPLLNQHRQYAVWLMWTSLMSLPVLWFAKREMKKHFRFIFIICLLGASILVSLTADKGGDMVYRYGVGIEQ